MKFPKRLAIAAFVLTGLVQVTNAQLFTNTYTGDYLPTDPLTVPTWQQPLPAVNTTASVNDGALTIASNPGGGGYLFYRQTPSEAWTGVSGTVEFVLRVDSQEDGYAWSQSATVATGLYFATIVFSLDAVTSGPLGGEYHTYALDTTETHSYWLSATDTGLANLYVDRNPVAVMTFQMADTDPNFRANYLEFGATTSAGAGTAEWDSVSWTNGSAFAPVPEPATFVLLGLAALVIIPLHRRFARRQQA